MSDGKAYVFGDVIRVDPEINAMVPQPDSRRWMVVAFDDVHKWTMLYLGGPLGPDGFLSHWSSLFGFVRVEGEE